MPRYFNGTGVEYAMGDEIGSGGEARVYAIVGRKDLVAKVFAKPTHRLREKLSFMKARPWPMKAQENDLTGVAWPRDLLHDHKGRFSGYLMQRVGNAVKLVTVSNPKTRAVTWPNFTLYDLYSTAANVASVFGMVHKLGYIIGDVNESNCLVASDAHVRLIDSDSFQVTDPSTTPPTTYLCQVGKPEYTPPELYGQEFRSQQRTVQHDCFGLAVTIFKLLMGGRHPFMSCWIGQGEQPTLEFKIRNGWFPYASSHPHLRPPNGLSLRSLHPVLAELFARCFKNGHDDPGARPLPAEWEAALRAAINEMDPRIATITTGIVECNMCHSINSLDDPYCQNCIGVLFGTSPCWCNKRVDVPVNVPFCPKCGAQHSMK